MEGRGGREEEGKVKKGGEMREGEGRERERRDTAWPDPSLVYATPLLISQYTAVVKVSK